MHRCDQRGIVLRHQGVTVSPSDEPSLQEGAACVREQFARALAQMKQRGDASKPEDQG